jgi:uncharacterized membrane-anchored protein
MSVVTVGLANIFLWLMVFTAALFYGNSLNGAIPLTLMVIALLFTLAGLFIRD